MRSGTIAFLCGTLLLHQFAVLPDMAWAWLIPLCLPLVLLVRVPWSLPAWAVLGFALALLHAHHIAHQGLAAELEGRDVEVVGFVASLPSIRERSTGFDFEIREMRLEGRALEGPGRVRLSWYGRAGSLPRIAPGEHWRLTVRLKRPHGFRNPGGFDYERWLFQHRIRATGYVRAKSMRQHLGSEPLRYPVQSLRHALLGRLSQALGDRPAAGIIRALAAGERADISPAQWETLRRTGTSHLVAISGLHIGLVAGLVFWLARGLWRWAGRGAERLPAPKFAALAALLAAAGYAALAGFSIPTQRALIMVLVVMLAVLSQRVTAPGRTLALALLAVLVWDPLAAVAPGFWLSFVAVAAILFALGGQWGHLSWWRRWGRVQWAVALALFPLLAAVFGQASLIAPLANLVAVPLFGLVVVPLTLVGSAVAALAPIPGSWLLQGASRVVEFAWPMLEWLGGLPFATWDAGAVSGWSLALAAAGCALLLAPRGLPARWTGILMLLPLVLLRPERPDTGQAWLTLLDVGQGLAAVVQTQRHTLVFDTGARFSSRFNAGEAVVAPYLRARGVRQVDTLVISHGDNDHIGGLDALLRQTVVRRVFTSVPGQVAKIVGDGPQTARRCARGVRWHYDGVEFEFLGPQPDALPVARREAARRRSGNNLSCVLQVRAANGTLLLTGDIERRAERELVDTWGEALRSTVLVAPHHGSKTSSTAAFLRHVQPRLALFPAGYRNRYGFPADSVLARYHALGVQTLATAEQGAIETRLRAREAPRVQSWRQHARRYWHTP